MKKHFVVAGGGLAGFTSAIELARHGHAVTLCEQSRTLGGRAATQHQDGYSMNMGPHGFYVAGVMNRQFREWGIPFSGKAPLGKGPAFLLSGETTYPFPRNASGLLTSCLFSASEKLALIRFFSSISKATAVPGESMQMWIDRQSSKPRARVFMSALTRLSTYAADLDLLDAESGVRQLQLAFSKSVLYIDGGWETLINALEAHAQQLGVMVRKEAGIAASEPGVVQLRDGSRLNADGIVLALPPHAVAQITGVQLPALTPVRAACLDLGLRALPPAAGTFALGMDQPLYLSVHSEYATGLAPDGGAFVQLAKYLKRDETGTREELESLADLVMPGWRELTAVTRFLPNLTVVHAMPAVSRPRPQADALGMPSVMIAGDWVGNQGMLADAAVASGLESARRLIQTVQRKAA